MEGNERKSTCECTAQSFLSQTGKDFYVSLLLASYFDMCLCVCTCLCTSLVAGTCLSLYMCAWAYTTHACFGLDVWLVLLLNLHASFDFCVQLLSTHTCASPSETTDEYDCLYRLFGICFQNVCLLLARVSCVLQ